MKKFSKIIVALLVVLCMAFSVVALSACGEGPAGPKGDKGDKGDTGATGAQGPAGATGANGASAWEMYQAWWAANNEGVECPYANEGEWFAAIINPEVHEHKLGAVEIISPNGLDKTGYGYRLCQGKDCDYTQLVILPSVDQTYVSTADALVDGAEPFALNFAHPVQGQSSAWGSLVVADADASKYLDITISNVGGKVSIYALNNEGNRGDILCEGSIGMGQSSITFSMLQMPAATYSVEIVVSSKGMTSAPSGATISIVEHSAITSTTVPQDGIQLTVGSSNTLSADNSGAVHYFTATEAGIYKITSANYYLALYTEDAYANWEAPFIDYNNFDGIDAYYVLMGEGAVFSFIPEFDGTDADADAITIAKVDSVG